MVVRAAAAGVRIRAVLATQGHAEALAGALPAGAPLYVAPHRVLAAVSGYPFHRGCLAVADVPPPRPFDPATLPGPACAPLTLADPSNLGAIARTAFVLGFRALLLPKAGADPFDPRAIRASAGCIFSLARIVVGDPEAALSALARAGHRIVGAETGGTPLDAVPRTPPPLVLAVGGEERGLTPGLRSRCEIVTIPTAVPDVSLNVHAAFAVCAHAFFGPAAQGA